MQFSELNIGFNPYPVTRMIKTTLKKHRMFFILGSGPERERFQILNVDTLQLLSCKCIFFSVCKVEKQKTVQRQEFVWRKRAK